MFNAEAQKFPKQSYISRSVLLLLYLDGYNNLFLGSWLCLYKWHCVICNQSYVNSLITRRHHWSHDSSCLAEVHCALLQKHSQWVLTDVRARSRYAVKPFPNAHDPEPGFHRMRVRSGSQSGTQLSHSGTHSQRLPTCLDNHNNTYTSIIFSS